MRAESWTFGGHQAGTSRPVAPLFGLISRQAVTSVIKKLHRLLLEAGQVAEMVVRVVESRGHAHRLTLYLLEERL